MPTNPFLRRTRILGAPSTTSEIRYMTDKGTIVRLSEVAALRTAEQRQRIKEGCLIWRHGGGVYHPDATIHPNAFIGLCCIVEDGARIGRYVSLEDYAVVAGRCVNNARIRGRACVDEGARVHGDATIEGNAFIGSGSDISGHLTVGGDTWTGENVILGGGGTLTLNPKWVRQGYRVEDLHFTIPSNLTISQPSQFNSIEELYSGQLH